MNYTAMRSRYLEDTVRTASPATLLTMLYDRLVVDLVQGEEALRREDRLAAGKHLVHAQDILNELDQSLDQDAWDGGRQLHELYTFLMVELVRANVGRDIDRVVSCREMVEPLRDSWRQAATELASVPTQRGGAGMLGVA